MAKIERSINEDFDQLLSNIENAILHFFKTVKILFNFLQLLQEEARLCFLKLIH